VLAHQACTTRFTGNIDKIVRAKVLKRSDTGVVRRCGDPELLSEDPAMKHDLSARMGLVAAVIAVLTLLVLPAAAAAQADRGSSGGGGTAVASGSGGTASGGGGADRGGGSSGGGFVGGSSGRDSGGNRGGATGGSGMAVPRAGSSGDHSGGGSSTPRYAGGPAARTTGKADEAGGERSGVPPHSRPHDPNAPTEGKAVPRPPNSTPIRGGTGITYVVPGGYYGGYGLGYGYGGFFGGYYDPWYDPWYGAYPGYSGGYQTTSDEGALRLKIKPKNAEVYVDGYFEGVVDDFDGLFQKLHLDPGVHRIEVRAAGYETLTFEVRITADHTTTYQGEMRRIQ
jgi:PEGA domain-containing protein